MVYSGKPSRGCLTCRTRRIKCDEGRPRCSQCIKSKRHCTGYRNQSDLIFRNETKATERRARRAHEQNSSPSLSVVNSSGNLVLVSSANKKPNQKNSKQSFAASIDPLDAWNLPLVLYNTNTLPRPLQQDPEALALSFFFHKFILAPSYMEYPRGYLQHLQPLFQQARHNSPIISATTATSLAIMGTTPSYGGMKFLARKKYSEALVNLRTALQDPLEAKADGTWASSLLLSLFQSVDGSFDSVPSWRIHTNGAAALAKARGSGKFASGIAPKLFMATRVQFIVSCMNRLEPVDEFFDIPQIPGLPDGGANNLTRLIIPIPGLRARAKNLLIKSKNIESTNQIKALMGDALATDNKLAHWTEVLPRRWQFYAFPVMAEMEGHWSKSRFWPGSFQIYGDERVAACWNFYRAFRCFLQGIIIRCGCWLSSSYRETAEYVQATTILQEMVNGICWSVPYHLGYPEAVEAIKLIPKSQHSNAASFGMSGHIKTIGGYLIMYPLFVGSSVITVSKEQRLWMKDRLLTIGQEAGINQATMLSYARDKVPEGCPVFDYHSRVVNNVGLSGDLYML